MSAQPRTRVVIQSRLNSSRLPGKALMTIGGMPLIELVARRASRNGHEVVVATSDEHYDTRIADHLDAVGIPVLRGPLDDVLGRFVLATADLEPDDLVVRLTGDNPVQDADVVDELIAATAASPYAYGRIDIDVVPEGLGAEVFTAGDLRRAAASTDEPYDREHVTPWLRRTLGELLFAPEGNPGDILRYRCTVDVLHDFDRVARLFADLDEPVQAPWRQVIAGLVAFTSPSVPLGGPGGWHGSRLLLDAASVLSGDAPTARATFAAAVDRGITHLLIGDPARDLAAVRAATEPQLVQRLGRIVVVPAADADTLAAAVEAAFADGGRRRLEAVLCEGIPSAQAWDRLQEFVADGSVGAAGVAVSAAQLPEALALDGVAVLVMDAAEYRRAGESDTAGIAVLITGAPESHPDLLGQGPVGSVSAVIAPATDPAEVTRLSDAVLVATQPAADERKN
ncbi:cytidylyltransferase domain-containing protein [Dermacoccaceae bacterium W4C1]